MLAGTGHARLHFFFFLYVLHLLVLAFIGVLLFVTCLLRAKLRRRGWPAGHCGGGAGSAKTFGQRLVELVFIVVSLAGCACLAGAAALGSRRFNFFQVRDMHRVNVLLQVHGAVGVERAPNMRAWGRPRAQQQRKIALVFWHFAGHFVLNGAHRGHRKLTSGTVDLHHSVRDLIKLNHCKLQFFLGSHIGRVLVTSTHEANEGFEKHVSQQAEARQWTQREVGHIRCFFRGNVVESAALALYFHPRHLQLAHRLGGKVVGTAAQKSLVLIDEIFEVNRTFHVTRLGDFRVNEVQRMRRRGGFVTWVLVKQN